MKKPAFLFSAFYLLHAVFLPAQQNPLPLRTVSFQAAAEGNGYRFTPQLPPLQQKAGAPQAYWKCYWEFGDGSFSFEEKPLHRYTKQGDYYALLCATAHYDDGKLPDKNGKGIFAATAIAENFSLPDVFDSSKAVVRLKVNRLPRAGEQMAMIMSYRNLGRLQTDGQLYVFYNEKKFPDSHFQFDTSRTHFGETLQALYSQIPNRENAADGLCREEIRRRYAMENPVDWLCVEQGSMGATGANTWTSVDLPNSTIIREMLANARSAYRDEQAWNFTELQPGEKRNLFLDLSGTEKMLKDTSAFIHIEAIFAPSDPFIAPERYVLELEIVSSHDPNAIAVSDNRVNYRIVKNKKLDYKIRFQNNGEGPASTVQVAVEIPKGLNPGLMRPLEWYPKCPVCPETPVNTGCLDTALVAGNLVFTFRNIYLPGSAQEGVADFDSTKGFVKYRIEPDRDMPKRAFRSRAKIIFDKNPPIYTNYTRTRFKTGLSPSLKIGYGFHPDSVQQGHFLIGAGLSPYKSWRVYPQVEVLAGIRGKEDLPETFHSTLFATAPNSGIALQDSFLTDTLRRGSSSRVSLEIPILLRRDFSRFFGIGLGASVQLIWQNSNLRTEAGRTRIDWAFTDGPTGFETTRNVMKTETVESSSTQKSRYSRYRLFLDLSLGSVRAGPHAGLRGGVQWPDRQPFVQVFLAMKL